MGKLSLKEVKIFSQHRKLKPRSSLPKYSYNTSSAFLEINPSVVSQVVTVHVFSHTKEFEEGNSPHLQQLWPSNSSVENVEMPRCQRVTEWVTVWHRPEVRHLSLQHSLVWSLISPILPGWMKQPSESLFPSCSDPRFVNLGTNIASQEQEYWQSRNPCYGIKAMQSLTWGASPCWKCIGLAYITVFLPLAKTGVPTQSGF